MATPRAHDVRSASRTAEPAGTAASSYTQFVDPRGSEANENRPKRTRATVNTHRRYIDPVGTEANDNPSDARTQGRRRTSRMTLGLGAAMCSTAALFDGAQATTFIFTIVGSLGAIAVGWIPLIGQFLGGLSLATGSALQTIFGIIIIVPGYLIMGFWFLMRDIPIFGGRNAALRTGTLMGTLIISTIPYLGALPDLLLWVLTMVILTFKEDKVNAIRAKLGYNRNAGGRMRRRYVSTHDA